MTEYELNQTFTNTYPIEAAIWCNEQGTCHIEETENTGGQRVFQIIENETETEEEKTIRIANLSLTAADVERAIYKIKGIDFDDIVDTIEAMNEAGTADIDIKALKIELKANYFYRGNEYVNKIGTILGFTSYQLDNFFETGDYTCLITDTNETEESTEA